MCRKEVIMATLDPSRSNINLIETGRYWNLVKRTLAEIFEKDTSIANELETSIYNANIEEQILFYHMEPLYTAADLAGKQQPSDDEVVRYFYLANQTGWRSAGIP
jgi:hypothetical protein